VVHSVHGGQLQPQSGLFIWKIEGTQPETGNGQKFIGVCKNFFA